jgi:FkbM family methyltransferase
MEKECGMGLSISAGLAAPAKWALLPNIARAGYALVLKRVFGLFQIPMLKTLPGLGDMKLEPWDLIDSRIFFFDVWEPAISKYMHDAVKPGDIVADIGANIGYYSLLLSRAVGPTGHVFAVEPSPEIRFRLQDMIDRNGIENVTVVPYGISDQTERRAFTKLTANLGASHFGELSDDGIELRSLDEVIPKDMLSRLSFIKIDVEGMEAQVMRSISTILDQLPRKVTICAELRIDADMRTTMEAFRHHGFDWQLLPNAYGMADYPNHPLDPINNPVLEGGQLDLALVRS